MFYYMKSIIYPMEKSIVSYSKEPGINQKILTNLKEKSWMFRRYIIFFQNATDEVSRNNNVVNYNYILEQASDRFPMDKNYVHSWTKFKDVSLSSLYET